MVDSDWVAIAVAGAGGIMATLGKNVVRVIGAAMILVAFLGWISTRSNPGADAQTPTINNNSPSINTFNQSGGNNTIIGNLPLPFGPPEQTYLVDHVSKSRQIHIMVMPDGRSMDLADRIFRYLKDNGYQVDPVDHSIMMAAGPNGPPRGVNITNPPDASEPTTIMVGLP